MRWDFYLEHKLRIEFLKWDGKKDNRCRQQVILCISEN